MMTKVNIPDDKGVIYKVDGEPVTGTVDRDGTVVVTAVPAAGYQFKDGVDTEWTFTPSEDVDSFE